MSIATIILHARVALALQYTCRGNPLALQFLNWVGSRPPRGVS